MHSDRHTTNRLYLTAVLRAQLEPNGQAIMLSNVRVVWDIPDLRSHGSDVMVISGLREQRNWSTFDVAEEGVRPTLFIEIVEPETRENDVERKVEHYTRAGVAQYVIVDNVGWQGQRQLQLLNYRLFSGRYQLQPTNNRGRVYLEVARLWPGIEGDHVFCYDEHVVALGEYVTVMQQITEALARVRREAAARAEIETRLRELEAELRRLRSTRSTF